MGEYIFTDVS